MPNKLLKEAKLKKQILEVIFKYIPRETCAIFLFGSLAQNKTYPVRDKGQKTEAPKALPISNGAYPSSDIDIGLISDKALKNSILVKIKGGLEEVKTLRDIDIADFSSIQDRNFLKIALREVKIWHQTKKSRAYLDNLKKRIAG